MKRILLFVLTNVMVVAVLGIVASLLGVNRYLTANGLNLGALLGFALIMGFGGAIISLLISKPMAKWTSGVRIIERPVYDEQGTLKDVTLDIELPAAFPEKYKEALLRVVEQCRRGLDCGHRAQAVRAGGYRYAGSGHF